MYYTTLCTVTVRPTAAIFAFLYSGERHFQRLVSSCVLEVTVSLICGVCKLCRLFERFIAFDFSFGAVVGETADVLGMMFLFLRV